MVTGQVKSRQRVSDHGEVFTPAWMVEAMLDLVKGETERIASRFLEPACGSGNFLVQIMRRKLGAVDLNYRNSPFKRRHYALLGLMCIYGIELLPDNITECRTNVVKVLTEYLNLDDSDELYHAALYVVSQNLVHGNARKMLTHDGQPIIFAEWEDIGNGKFQRRDFYFGALTKSASFSSQGTLFDSLGKHADPIPLARYDPVTMSDLATMNRRAAGLTI